MTNNRSSLGRVVIELHELGAILVETTPGKGFRMKIHEQNPGAPLSPFYLNLRTPDNPKPGKLTPEVVGDIGRALWDYAKRELSFQGIAGLPHAGTPLSYAFAEAARRDGDTIPLLELRKEVHLDGRRIGKVERADSLLTPGKTVLLLDDVATHGGSKEEAVESVRAAGFEVRDVLVFIDRGQGACEELLKLGVRLHALLTALEVIDILARHKKVDEKEAQVVREYLRAA